MEDYDKNKESSYLKNGTQIIILNGQCNKSWPENLYEFAGDLVKSCNEKSKCSKRIPLVVWNTSS